MKQSESKHGKGAGARIPEYPKPCLAVITVMNSALSWRSSPRRGNQLPRRSRCRSASCKQVRVKHRYRKIRLYCGVLFIRLIPMRYMNHGPVVPMYLCTRGHNPKGLYRAPYSAPFSLCKTRHQNSAICRRLKKSPFASTGICTASHLGYEQFRSLKPENHLHHSPNHCCFIEEWASEASCKFQTMNTRKCFPAFLPECLCGLFCVTWTMAGMLTQGQNCGCLHLRRVWLHARVHGTSQPTNLRSTTKLHACNTHKLNTNLHTPMHAHAAQRSHTYTCLQSICNSTVRSSSYTDLAGPSLKYEFSSVSEAQSTQLVPMRRLGRALLPQAKVHLTEIGDVQQVFAKVRLCGPNKSREDKA